VKKIELEIVALSSSVTQTHSYAVVLGELNGLRRLPIVIGAFEAQAIVVALERIKPSRPLTHDLFHNFLDTFHIELQEVLIHKLEEGIFFAKLLCKSGNEIIEMDSRTSDALALAVRIGCPIFTFENILEAAGLFMDIPEEGLAGRQNIVSPNKSREEHPEDEALHNMSLEELNELLNKILEQEDYVKAIAIRDEINRREEGSK
jgi:bifunctional DNase/RNase